MKRITNLLSFPLAGLALAAAAFLIFCPRAQAQTGDVKAMTDALMLEAAAVEKGDLPALDKLWANDDSVTVFESGHANYGWNDYRNNHLAPELKEFSNTKYSLSDLKVRVDGKTAWATFKYAISGDSNGKHFDGAGLGTAVLEKRGGRWQIVHWHSSSPRRPSQPAQITPKG